MTSRNAEIIDLDAYRKRRTVATAPASVTVLASVQGQMTPAPIAMAIASVFWPTWVFGPFFVTSPDEEGFGTA